MSSYRRSKYAARATEYRHVVIREVNTKERVIIGETGTGDQIEVGFSFHSPLVAIPLPGEVWSIKRDVADWRLDQRIDRGNIKYPIDKLAKGDRRLETPATIYIHGNTDVIINNQSWKALITRLQALEAQAVDFEARIKALEDA
jgi:hypothetical protein